MLASFAQINEMSKRISLRVTALVRESLEQILVRWRVNTEMDPLLYAVDKEFSSTCNYPKGKGKEFKK